MKPIIRIVAVLLAVSALTACSLPRGAALQSEITKGKSAESSTFQVVEVTRAKIPTLARWPVTGQHSHFHWPKTSSGANASVIRVGDTLDVTIWDSQENSLLTNPGQRFTQLANVTVGANGRVFLPYVNQVAVSGLTPSQARSRIQARLEPIVPSAQVQISLKQGRDNSVDAVGGVGRPGAYPLPSRNYKILNLIADAGGIPEALRNPVVRLIRGSKTYEIPAKDLYADGSKNALLHPRDTVIVEQDDRHFIALGASGTEDLIYFPQTALNALEAISLMGGINDSRADPKGILVLREYEPEQLVTSSEGPDRHLVVFVLDLTSADGLFAARKFNINPGDTVLATESPVTKAQTVFRLIGSVFGLTSQASAL